MSHICVVEHGSVLGIDSGKLKVTKSNGEICCFPLETVEGISIFSAASVTSQCMNFCLKNDVPISYFSQNGVYLGSFVSAFPDNATRLKKQVLLSENIDFSLAFGRKIIEAKINNQVVVLRRLRNLNSSDSIEQLSSYRKKALKAKDIAVLRGYEGMASKCYFGALSEIIPKELCFVGRSGRHAKDPVNALLNLGYSMLTKEIFGEIENRGLSSYIGFIHKDRINHPSLASDLIEEWRPVIVDSVVMNFIKYNNVDYQMINGNCSLSNSCIKKFMKEYERKLNSTNRYLDYFNEEVTFREALWHQAYRMVKVIDTSDVNQYKPVRIR